LQYYDRATALLQTDVLLVLEAFKLKDVGETNLDGLQITNYINLLGKTWPRTSLMNYQQALMSLSVGKPRAGLDNVKI